MKQLSKLLTLLLIAVLLLTTFGTQSSKASETNRILNERLLAEVPTFDPFSTNDIVTQRVHYQIYDTLFIETKDGDLLPSVCSEYSFNDSGDVLTFTIREGMKFHNGSTVTPEDVAFSLNTAIASSYTSRSTSTMESAEVIDGNKVVLKLKYAFAPVLSCLVNVNCAIVPKAVYEADSDAFGKNPIGSGPYMLDEVVSGERITLKAFPDYWRGEANIKTIVGKIIPDNTAALMALESGELDIMQPSQDYSDRERLKNNPNVVYYEAPGAVFYDVAFNCSKGVFTDKRLREAVAYAIDKEDLILGAVNGAASIVEAAIVPISPQYPDNFKPYEYNPEKAKELIAEAGYPNGLTVTMRVISASNYTMPAEVLQAQLRKVGIYLEIEMLERASWFEKVYSGGEYEITYYAHSVSSADADFSTYPFFHSSEADGAGNNYYNYKNAELDKLLEDARFSQDEEERKVLYAKIAEHVRDEVVCVPTYSGFRTMVAVKELKGVYADPMLRYYKYDYSW